MESSAALTAPSAGARADDLSSVVVDGVPLIDPRRPKLRLRPRAAWRHFTELLKDKERTEEVFHIFEALPWRGMRAATKAFVTSERGRAIRASEPSLPPILDDHAALRRLPVGTVGQVYCDFMEREGLTAQGLVDEFAKFMGERPRFHDLLEWYSHRLRDTHDLLHVLTGYGRDALGEQCVLAFTYSQQPSPAHLFIGYAGGLNIKKEVRSKAPVLRAIREGQRLGKACPRVAEMPTRKLLAMPLDEARRAFGISAPVQYRRAHAVYRAAGIDPYDLLGRAA
jgi:ubiquinone biosynthesis protein COQ4